MIYGVTNYDMEANKGERNLYSIPVNGGGAKQITTTAGTEYNVQVTPSGKMGYLSNGQWWEGNWDGTDAKQVTTIEGGIDNVKFSTDGKYVLFSQEVKIQNTVTERYPDLQKPMRMALTISCTAIGMVGMMALTTTFLCSLHCCWHHESERYYAG